MMYSALNNEQGHKTALGLGLDFKFLMSHEDNSMRGKQALTLSEMRLLIMSIDRKANSNKWIKECKMFGVWGLTFTAAVGNAHYSLFK